MGPGRDFGDQKKLFIDQSIGILIRNSIPMLDEKVGSVRAVPGAENRVLIFYNILQYSTIFYNIIVKYCKSPKSKIWNNFKMKRSGSGEIFY